MGDVVSCVTLQTSKRFYPFLLFVGTGTGKTVSLSPTLSLGAPGCLCMHVCMVYVCLYVCFYAQCHFRVTNGLTDCDSCLLMCTSCVVSGLSCWPFLQLSFVIPLVEKLNSDEGEQKKGRPPKVSGLCRQYLYPHAPTPTSTS